MTDALPASYVRFAGSVLFVRSGTDTLIIPRASVHHAQVTGNALDGYRLRVYGQSPRGGAEFFSSTHGEEEIIASMTRWLAGEDIAAVL